MCWCVAGMGAGSSEISQAPCWRVLLGVKLVVRDDAKKRFPPPPRCSLPCVIWEFCLINSLLFQGLASGDTWYLLLFSSSALRLTLLFLGYAWSLFWGCQGTLWDDVL